MSTIILNIFLISTIWVMITDIAQFGQDMEDRLSKWLGGQVHLKLLECSLCQTFWTSLIYLICTNQISILSVAIALFFAVNTPLVLSAYYTIKDALEWLLNKIRP